MKPLYNISITPGVNKITSELIDITDQSEKFIAGYSNIDGYLTELKEPRSQTEAQWFLS